mgnify:CR=1 FL=1
MQKLRYTICVLLMACLSVGAMAQNGLNAPFSQYGIGQSRLPFNMPQAAMLGGVVYTQSGPNRVNPFNPASYAAIQPTSFIFDMGLTIDMTTLRDPNTSLYDADGNLGYIAVAFPLTNWWKTSLGLLPLSDVNYESVQSVTGGPWGTMNTRYDGVGGVSRLYWGNGFNIGERLSVGFNANFLYGNISRGITYDFKDSTFFMDSRREKSTMIKNFTFDFGLLYNQPLNDKYTLNVGLTFTPHQNLRVQDKALVYTFVTHSGLEYNRDTIFPGADQDPEYTSTLEQPMVVGLGLSLARNKKWMIAFDGTYAPWNGFKYAEDKEHNVFGTSALQYGNNFRGSLGIQRLGNPDAAEYLRRVTFSAGCYREQGKLYLDPMQRLDEWGIGCGLSLPMRKGRSSLNISACYSRFGTAELLRHDIVSFGISIGSCETWFMKRKYN